MKNILFLYLMLLFILSCVSQSRLQSGSEKIPSRSYRIISDSESESEGISMFIESESIQLPVYQKHNIGDIVILKPSQRVKFQISYPCTSDSLPFIRKLVSQTPFLFQDLSISKCNDSARIREILRATENQKTLESVLFYSCDLTSGSLNPLANIKTITKLDIDLCRTDETVSKILTNTLPTMKLKAIYMDGGDVDDPICVLSKIPTLEKIGIDGGSNYLHVESLNRLKYLTELSVPRGIITSDDLWHLGKLKNISVLDLSENNFKSDCDFVALKNKKNIKKVDISGARMRKKTQESMKSIKRIQFVGEPNIIEYDL